MKPRTSIGKRRLRRRVRKGEDAYTLIETLVVLGLGAAILGSFVTFYVQGNRRFQHSTEHATMRAEALRCLETIGRDLEQLVVDNEAVWPDTGRHMLVEPFRIGQVYPETIYGTVPGESIAGRHLVLFRYHHVEMIQDPGKSYSYPQVVGQRIDYEAKYLDPADPARGMDLLRNGKRINHRPLYQVIFQKVPPMVALEQVQGAPQAFIDVTVVPMVEGIKGVTYDALKDRTSILRRKFHLIGYESQYTTILNLAVERVQSNALGLQKKTEDDLLKDYQRVVIEDARAHAKYNFMYDDIQDRVQKGNTLGYETPEETIRLDPVPFDDRTAGSDPFFAEARADIGEVDPASVDAGGLQVSDGGFPNDTF